MEETAQSLDEMFGRLDEIVEKLEGTDISLEEAFGLYRKGMDLLKLCNDKVDKIEKEVRVLDEEGNRREF